MSSAVSSHTAATTTEHPAVPGPRVVASPLPDGPARAGAHAGPTSLQTPVGEWTWQPGSGSWWYSAGLLSMLALPRTALAESRSGRRGTLAGLRLPHVHADDRPRLRAALEAAALEGRTFAVDVRFLRGDGRVCATTVTGGPGSAAADGGYPAVTGLVVDVTEDRTQTAPDDDREAALRREVEQLRTAMASRAVIEQAKGVLMVLVGCSDQVAFELLGHLSNHTHRKVREVAGLVVGSASGDGQLPEDVRQILRDACPPSAPTRP
ncbi:ANTAR domain-containing protein [Modestobacter sp. Leaf380]|uniref:ANTAR domain-containing protein n=1 Tax=Modestobacter sp. Leaf380 TaxID=1736356 RepID=UPI0006F804C0|nr:ANTAR domain-containing protein [Modestobacter sp. Leaf380]KQS68669.1 hypothetical protein ASG41_07005 [Modestobacter sp. Leaf380]